MGGLAESCRIPVLPYKHAPKWNSTMNKQHEPFTVAFDTQETTAGCGVRHRDLALCGAATVNTMIVRGREPVCFPPPARKIRFRIVVRHVGHLGNTVDNSLDAYMLLRYSGQVMTPSTFPPRLTFPTSQSANWLGELCLSTLSSSGWVPPFYPPMSRWEFLSSRWRVNMSAPLVVCP